MAEFQRAGPYCTRAGQSKIGMNTRKMCCFGCQREWGRQNGSELLLHLLLALSLLGRVFLLDDDDDDDGLRVSKQNQVEPLATQSLASNNALLQTELAPILCVAVSCLSPCVCFALRPSSRVISFNFSAGTLTRSGRANNWLGRTCLVCLKRGHCASKKKNNDDDDDNDNIGQERRVSEQARGLRTVQYRLIILIVARPAATLALSLSVSGAKKR